MHLARRRFDPLQRAPRLQHTSYSTKKRCCIATFNNRSESAHLDDIINANKLLREFTKDIQLVKRNVLWEPLLRREVRGCYVEAVKLSRGKFLGEFNEPDGVCAADVCDAEGCFGFGLEDGRLQCPSELACDEVVLDM